MNRSVKFRGNIKRDSRCYQNLFFVSVCLLILGLVPPILQAQESRPLSLYEAVSSNQLEVTIRGRSSTFIQPMVVLEAKSSSEQPLEVAIPVGSILSNDQGNYCDLVVLEAKSPLYFEKPSDSNPFSYELYAYCLNPTQFPSTEATYHPLDDLASPQVIDVLENIKSENGQETFAAQLAIWSVATGKDLSQLQQEMGADYSLYEAPVNKYLGVATLSAEPPVTSTPDVPDSSSVDATPEPTLGSDSATNFLLIAAGIFILGLILFAAIVVSSLRTKKIPSFQGQQDRSQESVPKKELPLDKFCVVCKQPFNEGKCVNPTCSSNRRGRGVSLRKQPERTEPISLPSESVVVSIEDSSPQPNNSSHQKGKVVVTEPAKAKRASQKEPFYPKTEPKVAASETHHEATEPIDVQQEHAETEPLGVADPAKPEGRLTLKVLKGDQAQQEYTVWGLQGVLSRGEAGQIELPLDSKVSIPQATLAIYHTQAGGKDRIRDLGSKNGTYHNDQRLPPNLWMDLKDGDLLQFGLTKLRYNQTRRQLEYEDGRQPELLIGNNRWLITRHKVSFVDFKSEDPTISVPHVYFRVNKGQLEVRDLSSGNGVYVRGRKIDGKELIFNEDVIQLGKETELQVVTDIADVPLEIGAWRRLKWLGGGGMADVYQVQHTENGVIRALKVPRPSKFLADDEEGHKYRELFRNEIIVAKEIHHDNLVEAHDFGEVDGLGLPYLVLGYIDGPSVSTVLEKLGKISAANVAEIVTQVGQALNALHLQSHYIHCDVKPSNIMIDYSGRVYLADLGVARPIREKYTNLGTKKYLPKEIIEGAKVGADTDIYSLGKTMFEMLTDQSPSHPSISDNGQTALKAKKEATEPTRTTTEPPATALMRLKSDGMEDITNIIIKCIEEKRDKRYQHVADLLKDLEPLRVGADLKALVDETGWKSSRI